MPDPLLSQMIFDSMTNGVVSLDPKGRITQINPAAADILGLDQRAVIGRPYPEIFFMAEGNDAFNQMILDLVYSQETQPYEEVSFERTDGQVRHLALTTSFLNDANDGGRQGALLVFKDITNLVALRGQRDELAGELAQKHEELRKAYLDLEERNKSLAEGQRRLVWIKLAAGLVGVLLFLGMAWFMVGDRLFDKRAVSNKALPPPDEAGVKLRSAKSRIGDVAVYVSSSGHLEPLTNVAVSSRVSGRLIEKRVQLGQTVHKGDLLFKIDKLEVLPKVRQAQAALLKAREQVDELANWSKRPETKQAKRALQLAEMDLASKERRVKESEQLFKEGIIPAEEMINSRNDLVRAQASLADAQERLSTALARGSEQKLTVARLEYENALATYKETRQMLDHTEVLAPVGGVVMAPKSQGMDKQTDIPQLGGKIQEGQQLLTLGVIKPLGVRALVSEADISKISLGQAAQVSTRALGAEHLPGEVLAVATQAQQRQGVTAFPVTIAIRDLTPNQRKNLRLGMSTAVRVIVRQAKQAVLVPVVAVSRRPKGPAVRVKNGDGYAWRPVTTGISDAEWVEIKSGLKPGEQVFF